MAAALLLPTAAYAFSGTLPFPSAQPYPGTVATYHPEIGISTLDASASGEGGTFVTAVPREATTSQISFEFRYTNISADTTGTFYYHVCAGVSKPGQTLTHQSASCIPIVASPPGPQWVLQDEQFGSVSLTPTYYDGVNDVPCTPAACAGGMLTVGVVRVFGSGAAPATMGFVNMTVNFQ